MAYRNWDRIPPIKAVMTPFPWYIHLEDGLEHARDVMREHDIRHLPVTNRGALVGVVTDRDVQLLLGPGRVAEGRDALKVEDACVPGAYVVDLSVPLDRVLREMAERHIGSALITKNGKLAGIFTATDACRCLAEYLGARFPTPGGDEAA